MPKRSASDANRCRGEIAEGLYHESFGQCTHDVVFVGEVTQDCGVVGAELGSQPAQRQCVGTLLFDDLNGRIDNAVPSQRRRGVMARLWTVLHGVTLPFRSRTEGVDNSLERGYGFAITISVVGFVPRTGLDDDGLALGINPQVLAMDP